jgi:septum formation protein
MASQFQMTAQIQTPNLNGLFYYKMHSQSYIRKLILASSSPYRKMLLQRLGITFEVFSPAVDESPRAGEEAGELVSRLANSKARAAAGIFPSSIIIGSDQLAVCNKRIVGKPGNTANAIGQLREFSGQIVNFLTAVSVICEETKFELSFTIVTCVRFRKLSDQEVHRYVETDNPIDCAGSFKSEAAGVSLLCSMTSDDPTAIIGLPLIAVSGALRKAGLQLP